ncbi:MAG: tyrosine-type recombinase/integrase [Vannielia sp.]|uniref:tyrosine-type recombinase/integrase n=1 Tax=Vannielia sp. TaxID=2813045 RepID=UPI003B8B1488
MPLTDTAVRNAKSRDKPYKVFDAGGLYLQVNSTGSRLWKMKYRYRGKEKLLSFGPYPLVGLKDARLKRDQARLLLLDGLDPSEEKKLERIRRDRERAVTFGVVGEEYIEKLEKEGRSPATLKKNRWLLAQTKPDMYELPVRTAEAPDVLRTLRKVEARGTFESAKRLRSFAGAVFRYAIATGRAHIDPTEALKGALIQHRVRPRAAILDRKELGKLLNDIDGFTGQETTRYALQLLAILAPRPGELRLAKWKEFDLAEAVWRIPADRMKMRRAHRVPLPPQAIRLLQELHGLTGTSEFLLPSARSWTQPISNNTLNAALRRHGYGPDKITAHGFRATFSTFANESGLWNPDAIERALAHVEGNEVRRAYARGEYWEERVKMAAWWADQLDQMRSTCGKNAEDK